MKTINYMAVPGLRNRRTIGVTTREIAEIVSEHTGIELPVMFRKSRKRELVMARQKCYYLCRKHTNLSLYRIGTSFTPKQDHATVIHSIKTVKNFMDVDLKFRQEMIILENEVSRLKEKKQGV